MESLRRQVHDLQGESAGKEVRIAQLKKMQAQDADDKEALNVALDGKQQELELVSISPSGLYSDFIADMGPFQIKRKLGVRGTAGSTPAPKTAARREPTAAVTPSSRLPALLREAIDRRIASGADTPLGTRPNGATSPTLSSTSVSTVTKPFRLAESAIPSIRAKPRMSVATPTPALGHGRRPSLSPSTSTVIRRPSISGPGGTPAPRRSTSGPVTQSPRKTRHVRSPTESLEEDDREDKENVQSSAVFQSKMMAPSHPRRKTLSIA